MTNVYMVLPGVLQVVYLHTRTSHFAATAQTLADVQGDRESVRAVAPGPRRLIIKGPS